jgi:hypothetical protein
VTCAVAGCPMPGTRVVTVVAADVHAPIVIGALTSGAHVGVLRLTLQTCEIHRDQLTSGAAAAW